MIAGITAVLVLGVWLIPLFSKSMGEQLATQNDMEWWIERAVLPAALGVVCVAVSFGVAASRWPALVLAALNLLIDAMTFGIDLKGGSFSFPLTGILCGLLIWRLIDPSEGVPPSVGAGSGRG